MYGDIVDQSRDLVRVEMDTQEAIKRTKQFRDFFGFDLADTSGLKTKDDCRNRLEEHRKWLETALVDAMKHLDNFEDEIGVG